MEFLLQCVYDYKRANVIVTSNKHNGPPSKPQLVSKRQVRMCGSCTLQSSSKRRQKKNTASWPRPQLQKCGNEKHTGRVWKIPMPRSVLRVGMLPNVLMRGRMSVQPISIQVRLMTGSKYTVEHRNFENWSSKRPIILKIWKRKFAEFRNHRRRNWGGRGGICPPNFTVGGALPPLFRSPVHII